MGCARSIPRLPASDKFPVLAAETPFNVDEVETLYELYIKLSNSVIKDGFIQKEDLQLALFRTTNSKNLFLDRMFDLFDVKQNGRIEFGEFVRTLSIFHPKASVTEKSNYAFRLYDLRGTGFIEYEELREMVLAILHESELVLSSDLVDSIVDKTFKEVDLKGDKKIDMEEWEEYVAKNPSLLKNMTLPYLMDINHAFPSFVVNKEAERQLRQELTETEGKL